MEREEHGVHDGGRAARGVCRRQWGLTAGAGASFTRWVPTTACLCDGLRTKPQVCLLNCDWSSARRNPCVIPPRGRRVDGIPSGGSADLARTRMLPPPPPLCRAPRRRRPLSSVMNAHGMLYGGSLIDADETGHGSARFVVPS